MPQSWNAEDVLQMARGYMAPAVLVAAAELELFDVLDGARTSGEVAAALDCDARGMATLLDALTSLGLLVKTEGRYERAEGVGSLLCSDSPTSILAGVQHQGTCLRRWSLLGEAVKGGTPVERRASVRGAEGDHAAFIQAMDDFNRATADEVVGRLPEIGCRHILDVGGAKGTWTFALLKRYPQARATIFDLPAVAAMARERLRTSEFRDRIEVAAGDFLADPLPTGADVAWVSAIIHQHGRAENRALFARLHAALASEATLMIRDIVMDATRTTPQRGALFAINMLVATEHGGTFTLDEIREDLESAGFVDVGLAVADEGMNAVVLGRKTAVS